jgi:REP element-mobilizing transposase RayT
VRLNEELRQIVMNTVREVCDYRGWKLHAVNCRSNHLHVVLSAPDVTPERVMSQLKSWCSRHLNERVGTKRREDWWTRHGSTLYLNSEAAVADKVDYTLNRQ